MLTCAFPQICIQDMERKSPIDFSFSPVEIFMYMLPLPYGWIEYPIILLILQNFLAGLPLPVHLESQPVCNYQIPLKRWALTLQFYL